MVQKLKTGPRAKGQASRKTIERVNMRKHRRLKGMGLGLVAVLLILAVTAAACGSESAPTAEGNTVTATEGETSDPTATTDSTATPSGPVESPTPKVYFGSGGRSGKPSAGPEWHIRMDQHGRVYAGQPPWRGGAGGLLDLHVCQLPQDAALP